MELPTRFDFNSVDDKWTRYWEESGCFHATPNPDKKPYGIVIPPPNVTGILHMGHALNNTLQDIIIRYYRMKGRETLWMPGTDHAGIATQNVVEKQLAKEGKQRHDIGREAFLKRLWAWKKQYGDTIIHQLKKLGSSCDWPRTRFTMDEGYSQAVKTVFVDLYKKGLIYQGEYIINWCPRCHTALSDEEAEHQETQGQLYYFRYPFKDKPKKFVVVATTRPETMLGDTAVAVNPEDARYKELVGQTLILPLVQREIKIIADDFVDPEFGTGAVKVTPAHDPNDFQMGQRHGLSFVNVMHPDARINEKGGAFNKMDRFDARKAVVAAMQEAGLVEKIEPHAHAVGHCYRCDTIVEPWLSKQWFVKMKPLAEPAIDAVKSGKIKFHPERWTKVYLNWMENIRDWCISRQIWWGHRIPVWTCPTCAAGDSPQEAIIVATEPPDECPRCHDKNLVQDEDVLDTWFSSWLWPFATLGWPEKKADLDYFYPTSSLFTASEIIFFWVARMIMAGYEFMGDIPFSDVYIHGTVRDSIGRKMSKSLGNAIDPLDIINEYGADALRYSLIINSGQDLFISKEKFEIGRNFANKIWNASRLILMNTQEIDGDFDFDQLDSKKIDLPSRWIISRFHSTLKKVSSAIEKYRFSEAETLIHEFFWGNFCDWYLEIIKDRWADKTVQNIVLKILVSSLKIIHPFMPFVTEEVFTHLDLGTKPLCRQNWPEYRSNWIDDEAEEGMQALIDIVSSVRNIRAQWNIKPKQPLQTYFASPKADLLSLLKTNAAILQSLANVDDVSIVEADFPQKNTAHLVIGQIKGAIPLEGIIDVDKEKARLAAQINNQKKAALNLSKRLDNENFLAKAPQDVITKEKERLLQIKQNIQELEECLSHF